MKNRSRRHIKRINYNGCYAEPCDGAILHQVEENGNNEGKNFVNSFGEWRQFGHEDFNIASLILSANCFKKGRKYGLIAQSINYSTDVKIWYKVQMGISCEISKYNEKEVGLPADYKPCLGNYLKAIQIVVSLMSLR